MKNALLTTTLAVLTGFAANAQMQKPQKSAQKENSFTIDARQPQTKTHIRTNQGDTVFVHATGQAYCNPSETYTTFARSAGPEGTSEYSRGINYNIRNPRFGALVIGHAARQRHAVVDFPLRDRLQGGVYASKQFSDLKKTPKGESFFIAQSKDEIVLDINDRFTHDNIGSFDVNLRVAPKLTQK